MVENVMSAMISTCGRYRYFLFRRWAAKGKTATFIMLNPSTADSRQDDPTIRRCIGFAKREECSALVVVNLFALRATDPAELRRVEDPTGPENVEWVRKAVEQAREHVAPIIAAWGANPMVGEADGAVLAAIGRAQCLGLTKAGAPRHPLYVPADEPLVEFRK